MKRRSVPLLFAAFFLVGTLMPGELAAQCAMCTKTAMDAMKDGNTASLGINNAILYLLCMPYALVMTIGGLWWWRRRKWAALADAEWQEVQEQAR